MTHTVECLSELGLNYSLAAVQTRWNVSIL